MQSTRLNFWPALLDLLAATLMVFLLVTFLQDIISLQELDLFLVRQQREELIARFEAALAAEIANGEVRLAPRQNALEITFSDQVLFRSARYQLLPEGRSLLERCRQLLASSDDAGIELIQIEGHTDSKPLPPGLTCPTNNWQLSAARAIGVVELLVEDPRIDPRCVSASGYAWFRPVASNDTSSGRGLNRRIEMRIFFTGASGRSSCSAEREQL